MNRRQLIASLGAAPVAAAIPGASVWVGRESGSIGRPDSVMERAMRNGLTYWWIETPDPRPRHG